MFERYAFHVNGDSFYDTCTILILFAAVNIEFLWRTNFLSLSYSMHFSLFVHRIGRHRLHLLRLTGIMGMWWNLGKWNTMRIQVSLVFKQCSEMENLIIMSILFASTLFT